MSQNGNNPDVRVDIDVRVSINYDHNAYRNIDISAPMSLVTDIDPTKAISHAVNEAIAEAIQNFRYAATEPDPD